MSAVAKTDLIEQSSLGCVAPANSQGTVWLVAFLAGLAYAWPLLCAAALRGPQIMIRSIGGDAYHYLAIARKSVVSHIYTYDGVHVTNGFHPLWEYAIRGTFVLLRVQSHESQAVVLMLMALASSTVGIILASAAIVRLTGRYFLGFLVVPGLFYLVVEVHVGAGSIWSVLDGMESSFSVLFGGLFFLLLSYHMGVAAGKEFDLLPAFRALGLILPFVILSRLDDVFIIPAFLIALLLVDNPLPEKVCAVAWVAVPSAVCILCYLVYNKLTAGAAMPLSGGTKAGFVGFITAYQSIAIHFPPLFDLKTLITRIPVDVPLVMSGSFRQVQVVYPIVMASFGALAVWKFKRNRPEFPVLFGLSLFIPFKMGYNLLEVNLWGQDVWYYQFPLLTLSILGALALQHGWATLDRVPIAKAGIATIYFMLMMLSASQYYASIVYRPLDNITIQFWDRKDEIRRQIVAHGVTGIINFDDGITAFLLDLPNMHGFAFATDVEAQHAHRDGHMLSLAYARGINTIAGIGYLRDETAPASQADIRQYLSNGLVSGAIRGDVNDFDFALAYYDPVLKMPFVTFKPKAGPEAAKDH
jgi:hypothetical protein